MKLSVFGCGYLGAVHAASMAVLGHDVIGVDIDAARIPLLGSAKAPVHGPGFDDLLGKSRNQLTFTTDMSAVKNATVHFLGVGTPQTADGSADVTRVDEAVIGLLPRIGPGHLVVGKSSVPVETAAGLSELIAPPGPR